MVVDIGLRVTTTVGDSARLTVATVAALRMKHLAQKDAARAGRVNASGDASSSVYQSGAVVRPPSGERVARAQHHGVGRERLNL
jgi:hypothetical protein